MSQHKPSMPADAPVSVVVKGTALALLNENVDSLELLRTYEGA